MTNLIFQIIAGIISLFLTTKFIPGVEFTGSWQQLLLAGGILGLANFFLKPILNLITLPLRTLTFGLFSLVINMGIVWLVDILFPQLIIPGLVPLFWTTVIVWLVSFLLGLYQSKKKTIKD